MELEITMSPAESQTTIMVLHLKGRINMGNASQLEAEAQKCHDLGAHFLILDMAGLESMTSAGLRSLLTIAKSFQANETGSNSWEASKSAYVKLAQPSPEINNTLRIAGFNVFFDIFSDIQQAISSLQ